MEILLKRVGWLADGELVTGDIRIGKGLILDMGKELPAGKKETILSFGNHFVYPGLINAHDHLEMNLYSHLGTPPYTDYLAWAHDIYKPSESPLIEIEKTDRQDRLLWGGIKNMISGVSTVVHHNPWHRSLGRSNFPVNVLKEMVWAHSPGLEKKKLETFLKEKELPFVIHAAEGMSKIAYSEISKLNDIGLLRRNTVLIHAIALHDKDIEIISDHHASVIWCPASNLFMFGRTAPIEKLKDKVRIAIGSDSTLTGSATLLEEMKAAAGTGLATEAEIFNMVTQWPAAIFNLPVPVLAPMMPANLFVAKAASRDYVHNAVFLHPSNIDLVMQHGDIRLLDKEQQKASAHFKYEILIQGVRKSVYTDVAALKRRIEKKVSLEILGRNPLWKLVEV